MLSVTSAVDGLAGVRALVRRMITWRIGAGWWFIGDFTLSSLVTALVTLLIVCALVRLMIGVFLRGNGGSILAVAVLHTAFNRSNNGDGVVAGLAQGQARGLAGLIAVIVLTAAVAIIALRRPAPSHDHRVASRLSASGPIGPVVLRTNVEAPQMY